MMRILEKFEKLINGALLVMISVIVLLTTIDLGWMIIKDIAAPPVFLIEVSQLLNLFAAFLLVLIGVELLDTVKVYLTEKTIHLELILAVGLVAMSRKVIILDPKTLDGLSLIGIAAVIAALGGVYFLVRRGQQKPEPD